MKLKLPNKREMREEKLQAAESEWVIRGWILIIFGFLIAVLPTIALKKFDIKFIILGIAAIVAGFWMKYGLKLQR